jgi:Bacterial extracellular solute-binding proteins, family 5 Middle
VGPTEKTQIEPEYAKGPQPDQERGNCSKDTWDLLQGTGPEKLRINPRKSWYQNLAQVTIDGDYEVSFHLKRPQPSFIGLVASGWSPVYPCHVTAREMRQHSIGTGPFKFVEFKPNESIKLTRNPDDWKPGRPYLEGIEYTIIRNASTWILALGAHQFDRTGLGFVPVPLLKEIKRQAPEINCEIASYEIRDQRVGLAVHQDVAEIAHPDAEAGLHVGITPTGIKTSDAEYEFDIIIYATGFESFSQKASRSSGVTSWLARGSDAWMKQP